MDIKNITYKDYSLCSADFINGVEFLKRGMISQSRHCFELAYEKISYDDMHYSKYASFCGYARILSGDRSGLSICREVARDELYDGDVFYNLAKAEWYFKDRKHAINALIRGIDVDCMHPGIRDLCKELHMRKKAVINFLPRNHMLNNRLGKLFRK